MQSKLLLILPVTFLLVGCLTACSLQTPYPNRTLYTITPGSPDSTYVDAQPAHNITLCVRRIVAVAPYGGTGMVTRTAAHSLAVDYYNCYAAPPSDLLTSELIQWMRSTNTFAAVTDGSGGLPHQWALEGRLQQLLIDNSTPAAPEAVLTLELVLLDDTGAVSRCVMEKTYAERLRIPTADPASGIEGLSKACRALFVKAATDMKSFPQTRNGGVSRPQ